MLITDAGMDPQKLVHYIDHTLLRPEATEAEISKLCTEAVEFGFKTVCVEKQWLRTAIAILGKSPVLPITVIAFPTGEGSARQKAEEATQAIHEGAKEVDMVLNRKLLHEKNYAATVEEVRAVVDAVGKTPVKVILETSELSNEEKIIACALCKVAGAAFVKTSTGFSKSGATESDIRLMRQTVGEEMGVKASGGIRTYADALKMIRAGASRVGASASVAIVQEARRIIQEST